MPSTASLPPDQYLDVLSRLPSDLNLDVLARETKAIERGRVVCDGAVLLRLALARGPGGLSVSQTAAWASVLGLAEMSDPAIKYRLDKAAGFLNALLERQLAGNTTHRPAAGLDASCASPTVPRSASQVARAPTGGYHARDTGRAEASLPALPLRMIALRKSSEATEAERKRLRQSASRKQNQLDPRSLEAAEFVMLATSLAKMYAAEDIIGADRLRWQVELAIKRVKSLIHTDELLTHTPEASRRWLLSHLLLAALTEDMTQDLLDSFP
jgi:hypothetical protein